MSHHYWLVLLFVTSGLPMQAVVTQDSPNDIMALMSFNWKEILTCRPNCIWLKTILVLLLANWLGRVGRVEVWQDQWCPCGNIVNNLQLVMKRMEQKHGRRLGQMMQYSTWNIWGSVEGKSGKIQSLKPTLKNMQCLNLHSSSGVTLQ